MRTLRHLIRFEMSYCPYCFLIRKGVWVCALSVAYYSIDIHHFTDTLHGCTHQTFNGMLVHFNPSFLFSYAVISVMRILLPSRQKSIPLDFTHRQCEKAANRNALSAAFQSFFCNFFQIADERILPIRQRLKSVLHQFTLVQSAVEWTRRLG